MAEAVGEDSWLALVDEESRTANNLVQRVEVIEKYKQAIAAVPASTKLWMAYCEWVWSLHTDCQTADAGWPEEEQIYGQELFSLQVARDVWQQGAQATQYRLNDSHELWNRWMSIELEQLSKAYESGSATQKNVEYVRRMFVGRLQIPHSTWDDTSQMFSTFLSKYDNSAYEATMIQITALAKNAKKQYADREISEIKLRRASESGDTDALKAAMKQYLEWEVRQWEVKQAKLRRLQVAPLDLCVALYERALSSTTIFGLDSDVWLDYIVFLSRTKREFSEAQLPTVLSVIQRSVTHCPWSGELWSRYILRAETEKVPHADIENIKHAATDNKALDRDGMEALVDVYVAWCGYLKRRTLLPEAIEEDMDVAEMGLHTALESVQNWGRKHDKNYKGDPLFRIERILIQLLTQKGSIQDARGFWKGLIHANASSYEFWQQYYLWEISVRPPVGPPSLATEVLIKAVYQENLDWPEKMLEVYVRHCINFGESGDLDLAMDIVHERKKAVAKRRQNEQEAAAATAAAYYAQQPVASEIAVNDSPSAPKRKREGAEDDSYGNASKKVKGDQPEADHQALREQHLKRDRENTSILVSNLPPEVTQTKIRQYFKEYGHINTLTTQEEGEGDDKSTTALIEFRSNEDVQSALIRDGKYFTGSNRQIRVQTATGLTLYVTNFPPEADDSYFHNLFKDCGPIFSIRWPSLKYNAYRRFCYISFRTPEGAAAAAQLNGTKVKGGFKLSVAYSDPSRKKAREGATAEGREVHITSLDSSLAEDDVRGVFAKYGTVESVRMMKSKGGENTGAAFVVFEKKEEAEASLELDKTKLKSRIMKVEVATGKNFKPIAISKGSSASPAPDPNPDGHSVMSPSPTPEGVHAGNGHNRDEISRRTMILMNVPDTVNDARIRALAEPYGTIVKVVLRPDHQGAIIEYADIASAGRAALALENHEIVPGRKLRTGGLKDLFGQKGEMKTDKIQVGQAKKAPATFMQPSAPIRRPGASGRGGLGQKRGLGFSAPKTGEPSGPSAGTGINGDAKEEATKPKSNADFKAMFVSGGKE